MPMGRRFRMARRTSRSLNARVAFESDVADLDLRSLIHFEHDVQGRRREGLQLRHDGGELPAALRQVILQHHLGALDFVPVVGRFRRQSDAAFFEPVQDFGSSDGFQPVVLDGAHHRPLRDLEGDDPAGLARLPGPFDIVEAVGVPQRDQVAVQRLGLVGVALLGEDHGAQSVLRHRARALEVDGFDGIGRPGGRKPALRARRAWPVPVWAARVSAALAPELAEPARTDWEAWAAAAPVVAGSKEERPPAGLNTKQWTRAGIEAWETASRPGSFPLCACFFSTCSRRTGFRTRSFPKAAKAPEDSTAA